MRKNLIRITTDLSTIYYTAPRCSRRIIRRSRSAQAFSNGYPSNLLQKIGKRWERKENHFTFVCVGEKCNQRHGWWLSLDSGNNITSPPPPFFIRFRLIITAVVEQMPPTYHERQRSQLIRQCLITAGLLTYISRWEKRSSAAPFLMWEGPDIPAWILTQRHQKGDGGETGLIIDGPWELSQCSTGRRRLKLWKTTTGTICGTKKKNDDGCQ